MKPVKPLLAAAAVAATTLLLAACGGSDDDPVPVEDPTLVPSNATSSAAEFFKFAGALMSSETAEALLLTNVSSLPTSETDEPTPLPR